MNFHKGCVCESDGNLVEQQPSGCTEPLLWLLFNSGTLSRAGKIRNNDALQRPAHKRKHTPDARAVKHWRVLRHLIE